MDLQNSNINDTNFTYILSGIVPTLTELYLDLSDTTVSFSNPDNFQTKLEACKKNLTRFTLKCRNNSIGGYGAQNIGQAVKICQELQYLYLDLSNCSIGDGGLQLLLNDTYLEDIKDATFLLEGNNISDESICAFGQQLQIFYGVENLNIQLNDNRIDEYGSINFINLLSLLMNLESLTINYDNNSNISHFSVKRIFKSLTIFPSLTSLSINIGNTDVFVVIAFENFKENITLLKLKELTIEASNDGLDDQQVSLIAKGIQASQNLVKLEFDFSFNRDISSTGILDLINGIKQCPELIQLKLDLKKTQLGNDGCKFLANGLQECEQLSVLSLTLEDCLVGTKGITDLAEGLGKCKLLKDFSLMANKSEFFGDTGAEGLTLGLSKCPSLSKLVLILSKCEITFPGGVSIFEHLSKCQNLKDFTLDLTGSHTIEWRIEQISRELIKFPVISNLKLLFSFSSPRRDEIRILMKHLKQCEYLYYLHLSFSENNLNDQKAIQKIKKIPRLVSYHV